MRNNCNKCKDCWNASKSSACSCSDTISYKELTSLRYDPLNPSQLQYSDNAGKVVNLIPPSTPSAYDVAVENGYIGTEVEWLQSLNYNENTTVNQITDTGKTYNNGVTTLSVYSVSFKQSLLEGGIYNSNITFEGLISVLNVNDITKILTLKAFIANPDNSNVAYPIEIFGGYSDISGTSYVITLQSTVGEMETVFNGTTASQMEIYGTLEFTSSTSNSDLLTQAPATISLVIIQDVGESTHGQTIRNQFIIENPSYELEDFKFDTSNNAYAFAAQNGLDIIIRSTTGVDYYASIAEPFKESVLLIMPLGSNIDEELDYSGTLFPWVICTGAGDSINRTAFGNNLDFFDVDDTVDGTYLSSYSTGRIAGKLKAIKDARNNTWWDTINAARETATRTATTHPLSEKWNKNNGYGIINTSAAIAYTGTLPATPYYNE
jgi:hypothetical protein